jgi:CRP/FNR family cyclic AMP-dependent transcriptional regulator
MSVASPLGRRRKASLADYIVKYPAGEAIYLEGEIGTEMYTIRSGEVEIERTLQGRARPLALYRRGDFFGETSLLDDLPREETARARTDVVLVRINGTILDGMLKTNAEVALRMMRKLSRRTREVEGARGRPDSRNGSPASREPPAVAGAAAFELVSPDGAARFPVREGDTIIGRGDPGTGSTSDVDLLELDPEGSVSRRHARLYRIGEAEYLMEELGVVNGTFVNNVRLATGAPVAVRHGDLVRFGRVTLTFWKPA